MMEAVSVSKTSVNFYETTRRNTPEDGHLHTCRRENLKPHLVPKSVVAVFCLTCVHTSRVRLKLEQVAMRQRVG
jgi:hypothetical protein